MSQFRSLEAESLDRFLLRSKASATFAPEVDLGVQLRVILRRACDMVPSESGSILLDDPVRKEADVSRNDLYFIAAFGPASDAILGKRMTAGEGVAGWVYRSGEPRLSITARNDAMFSPRTDEQTGYRTESIVAVPVRIGQAVCGVLELVNRLDAQPFSERDLRLLEAFAGYTSWTLQNALDAKRANELARRDDLTGLYNQRWLHAQIPDVLREAEQNQEPCSLLFIDLDHFKEVNDTHGHIAGSQVLREIGFIVRRIIHQPRAIATRYGGDEFAILLPGISAPDAASIAEELRVAIETNSFLSRVYEESRPPLHLKGVITASVGVAQTTASKPADETAERMSRLIANADTAMYQAKALGKNRVVISD
jgi:diguanylate cyclase (GGDEF)-like protein